MRELSSNEEFKSFRTVEGLCSKFIYRVEFKCKYFIGDLASVDEYTDLFV